MRFTRFVLFLLLPFIAISGWAQQAQPPTSALPPAPQDPQAVGIINQALLAAGGAQAVAAVQDYTASGTVTYGQNTSPEAQGSVTIKGRGAAQFRMDANLPAGMRSQVVNEDGTANGQQSQPPPTTLKKIPSSDAFPVHSPIFPGGVAFPYLELVAAMRNARYAVSDKGLTQMDGRSVHDIQVQRVIPKGTAVRTSTSPYDAKDYFIDASTFQIVMTQDLLPKLLVRQIQYSKNTPVNGVLVPFSINEMIGGQQAWATQINQIVFNSGLQDSTFSVQ